MHQTPIRFIVLSILIACSYACSPGKLTSNKKVTPTSHANTTPTTIPEWALNTHQVVIQLGTFNWIVIAEPAFPSLSRDGITTINADASNIDVLQQVLSSIEHSGHVRPKVYIAKESLALKEKEAPGIKPFITARESALRGREARALHSNALEILLMDAKKKHRILVIKTNSLLPYTSTFIELESGYWDGAAESSLRKRMKN